MANPIELKFENSLTIPDIIDVAYATDETETPDNPQKVGVNQQTKMTGIIAPLIRLNNITINFNQIFDFSLNNEGIIPTLVFSFDDTFGFTKSIDQPGNDNICIVQILPPFDNAYKKIKLQFNIKNISILGNNRVSFQCIYGNPDLLNDSLESLGLLTTYELCEDIAKRTKLGFQSNLAGTNDKRYMFCGGNSLLSLFEREVECGGEQNIILDGFIDLYNNINLFNIYELYNSNVEVHKIWIKGSNQIESDSDSEIKPEQVDCAISNGANTRQSPLFVENYRTINNIGSNITLGSDKVYNEYIYNNLESIETLIQDGDVKNDIFVKTKYLGENIGEYNYLLQRECNKAYHQKIRNQIIEVKLKQPMLGIIRGDKVNFIWYEMNELLNKVKDEADIQTNLPIDNSDEAEYDTPRLNLQVSGQYLVIGSTISYKRRAGNLLWEHKLLLARPQDKIQKYL